MGKLWQSGRAAGQAERLFRMEARESLIRKAYRANVTSEVSWYHFPTVRSGERFYAKFAELSMTILT
jgi:hypothetical protein